MKLTQAQADKQMIRAIAKLDRLCEGKLTPTQKAYLEHLETAIALSSAAHS